MAEAPATQSPCCRYYIQNDSYPQEYAYKRVMLNTTLSFWRTCPSGCAAGVAIGTITPLYCIEEIVAETKPSERMELAPLTAFAWRFHVMLRLAADGNLNNNLESMSIWARKWR